MVRVAVIGIVASLALAAADPWSATLVDLASEWERAELYNTNQGALRLSDEVKGDVHGYVVLVGGKIVAEHYASGRDADTTSQIWSVTKSWSALLVGTLMRDGLVTADATLAEIWPNASWSEVSDADAKRSITLQQLLQMRTGMHSDGGSVFDQNSLVEALNYCEFNSSRKGEFAYVNHQLLAHVVHAITDETPRAYAERMVWPALGISADKLDWWANEQGVQHSAFGLLMAPRQMAKLGQLYLQRGKAGPDSTGWLIEPDFVDDSTRPWGGSDGVCIGGRTQRLFGDLAFDCGYGYQLWNPFRADDEFVFSAVGHNGQYVAVFPERDMVVAITGNDTTPYDSSRETLALIPELDFSVVPDDSAAAPSCTAGPGLLALLATVVTLGVASLS